MSDIHKPSGFMLAAAGSPACPYCNSMQTEQVSLDSDERISLRIGRHDFLICNKCRRKYVRVRNKYQ